MPNYTEIPKEFKEEYFKKFSSINLDEIPKLAEEDPVIFAFYYLGKKPRMHQAYLMHRILDCWHHGKRRLAMCLARQLGKSIMLGLFLIWAGWYNKFPTTILKQTTIYLISRDDDASVELLDKIRGILYDGNRNMVQYHGTNDFFTGSLKEPNNLHQITFLNGCFIKSIPPTGKVLGKSASIVVIDEAHRLENDDPDKFFNQFVTPTTAETGGMIILSSSPEGIVGFFYEAIDPDNKNPNNQYDKIWFSHAVWDDGSMECLRYQVFVEDEKGRLANEGKLKYWQQEYEAMFTVTQISFFDYDDIENSIKDTPELYEWHDTPCSVGYDYGSVSARTVITIRTMIKEEIIQLFQFRSPASFDNNLLIDANWEHSFQNLKRRYNLFMINVDDSPPGDSTNRWLEKNAEIQINKYNFRSDQMRMEERITRNNAAYTYKAKMKQGILKIPKWNTIQIFEMRIIQENVQKVLISIKAPEGHLCDTFDSDMMACLPFLDMNTVYDFDVDIPKGIETEKPSGNPWHDNFHSPTDDECKQMIRDANEFIY